MPVIKQNQPLEPRAELGNNNNLSTRKIIGITLIVTFAIAMLCVVFYRRRQLWRRRKQAEASRDSQQRRRFLRLAFPQPANGDPALPPYEPPREGAPQMDMAGHPHRDGAGRSRAANSGASTPRSLPPARVSTPPGYGLHVADRPAGPLSELPPAYREHEEVSWGRSGCPR